jgi:hypothetical protein
VQVGVVVFDCQHVVAAFVHDDAAGDVATGKGGIGSDNGVVQWRDLTQEPPGGGEFAFLLGALIVRQQAHGLLGYGALGGVFNEGYEAESLAFLIDCAAQYLAIQGEVCGQAALMPGQPGEECRVEAFGVHLADEIVIGVVGGGFIQPGLLSWPAAEGFELRLAEVLAQGDDALQVTAAADHAQGEDAQQLLLRVALATARTRVGQLRKGLHQALAAGHSGFGAFDQMRHHTALALGRQGGRAGELGTGTFDQLQTPEMLGPPVLLVKVRCLSATASRLAQRAPVGGLVASAGSVAGIDEGFRNQRHIPKGSEPIFPQSAQASAEDLRGEIGPLASTEQQAEAAILHDELEACFAQARAPANPMITVFELVGSRPPGQQSHWDTVNLGDVAQGIPSATSAFEVMMLTHLFVVKVELLWQTETHSKGATAIWRSINDRFERKWVHPTYLEAVSRFCLAPMSSPRNIVSPDRT